MQIKIEDSNFVKHFFSLQTYCIDYSIHGYLMSDCIGHRYLKRSNDRSAWRKEPSLTLSRI